MSPQIALLEQRYPTLFTSVPFGVECGDGWFDIIDRLSAKLEPLTSRQPGGERMTLTQIKEKFGTLRYYVSYVPDGHEEYVYEQINAAEKESARTC